MADDLAGSWRNEGGDHGSWFLDAGELHRLAVYWDGGPHDGGYPFGFQVEDRRTGKPVLGYGSSCAPELETAQYCAAEVFREGPQEPITPDELPF